MEWEKAAPHYIKKTWTNDLTDGRIHRKEIELSDTKQNCGGKIEFLSFGRTHQNQERCRNDAVGNSKTFTYLTLLHFLSF